MSLRRVIIQEEKGILGAIIGAAKPKVPRLDTTPGDRKLKPKKRYARFISSPSDADGDRVVQEGTIHERQIGKKPKLPPAVTSANPTIKPAKIKKPDLKPGGVIEPKKPDAANPVPKVEKPKLPPRKRSKNPKLKPASVEKPNVTPEELEPNKFVPSTSSKKPKVGVLPPAKKGKKTNSIFFKKNDKPIDYSKMDVGEFRKLFNEKIGVTDVPYEDMSNTHLSIRIALVENQIKIKTTDLKVNKTGASQEDIDFLELGLSKLIAERELRKKHPKINVDFKDDDVAKANLEIAKSGIQKFDEFTKQVNEAISSENYDEINNLIFKIDMLKQLADTNEESSYLNSLGVKLADKGDELAPLQPGYQSEYELQAEENYWASLFPNEPVDPEVALDIANWTDGPDLGTPHLSDDTVLKIIEKYDIPDQKQLEDIDFNDFFVDGNGNPMILNPKSRYGVMMIDKNTGKVVMIEPKNHFGGYHWTVAKGGSDPGENPIQTARREVLEETGFEVEIVDALPQGFVGTTSNTHMFVGFVDFKKENFKQTDETQNIEAYSFGEEIQAAINQSGPQQATRDLAIVEALQERLREIGKGGKTLFDGKPGKETPNVPDVVPEPSVVDVPPLHDDNFVDTLIPSDKQKFELLKDNFSKIGLTFNKAFRGRRPGSGGFFRFRTKGTAVNDPTTAQEAFDALEGVNGVPAELSSIPDVVLGDALVKYLVDGKGKRFKKLNSSAGVNDWATPFSEHAKGTFVFEDTFTGSKYILKTPVRDDLESSREVSAAIVSNLVGIPVPVPRLLGEPYTQQPVDVPSMPGGTLTKGNVPTTNRMILIEHFDNFIVKTPKSSANSFNTQQIGRMLAQQYLIGEPDNHSDNRMSVISADGSTSVFAFDAGKAFTPHVEKYGEYRFGGKYRNVLDQMSPEQKKETLKVAADVLDNLITSTASDRITGDSSASLSQIERAASAAHAEFVKTKIDEWKTHYVKEFGPLPGDTIDPIELDKFAPVHNTVHEASKSSVHRALSRIKNRPKMQNGLSDPISAFHDGPSIRGHRLFMQDGFRLRRKSGDPMETAFEHRATLSPQTFDKLVKQLSGMSPADVKVENTDGYFAVFSTGVGIPIHPTENRTTSQLTATPKGGIPSEGNNKTYFFKIDDNTYGILSGVSRGIQLGSVLDNEREASVSRMLRVFSLGEAREKALSDPTYHGKLLAKFGIEDRQATPDEIRQAGLKRFYSAFGGSESTKTSYGKIGKIVKRADRTKIAKRTMKKWGISESDIEVVVNDSGSAIPRLSDEAAKKLFTRIASQNPSFGNGKFFPIHSLYSNREESRARLLTTVGLSNSADRFVSDVSTGGQSSEADIGIGSGNSIYWTLADSYSNSAMKQIGIDSGSLMSSQGSVVVTDPQKFFQNLDMFGNTTDSFGDPGSGNRYEDMYQAVADGNTIYEIATQNPGSHEDFGASIMFSHGGRSLGLHRLLGHLDDQLDDGELPVNSKFLIKIQNPTNDKRTGVEERLKVGTAEVYIKDGVRNIRLTAGGDLIYDTSDPSFRGMMMLGTGQVDSSLSGVDLLYSTSEPTPEELIQAVNTISKNKFAYANELQPFLAEKIKLNMRKKYRKSTKAEIQSEIDALKATLDLTTITKWQNGINKSGWSPAWSMGMTAAVAGNEIAAAKLAVLKSLLDKAK